MSETVPPVRLPGSDDYWDAMELAEQLEQTFPGQDAIDFALACAYNDRGPVIEGAAVERLVMLRQGANEEGDWIWYVEMEPTPKHPCRFWVLIAGCDYTGWDCQSDARWMGLEGPWPGVSA